MVSFSLIRPYLDSSGHPGMTAQVLKRQPLRDIPGALVLLVVTVWSG